MEKDDQHIYELVDGKLVEKQMSSLANETAGIIGGHLFNFLRKSGAGKHYPEQGFQCFPDDPELVRRPDIAVIVTSRLALVPEEGNVPIRPDLAIEVISPGDKIYQFEQKLADYEKAGIPLVWEVNPKFRFIRVHRPDRKADRLKETDIIAAEPILPGFSVLVSELLPA